jgi:hypothetical protein
LKRSIRSILRYTSRRLEALRMTLSIGKAKGVPE